MTVVPAGRGDFASVTDLSKSDMVGFLFVMIAMKEFEIIDGSWPRELTCSAYLCSNVLIY
ncbi:MAG: hypothetical protein NPIRA06_20350 [Nitrospirales bacterium]|nr:MAG: hypothetical protein NPIRA06_20350 [Nitrospirales bacterium]